MFREHHEADSFAIRGYAPDADPMNAACRISFLASKIKVLNGFYEVKNI